MVYHKFSAGMKQRALELLEDGWEMDEVTEALGGSDHSINRSVDNYEEFGQVEKLFVLHGRPRLLNAAILDDLHELIHENPSHFLDEIGEWLVIYHDQPISTTSLVYGSR